MRASDERSSSHTDGQYDEHYRIRTSNREAQGREKEEVNSQLCVLSILPVHVVGLGSRNRFFGVLYQISVWLELARVMLKGPFLCPIPR